MWAPPGRPELAAQPLAQQLVLRQRAAAIASGRQPPHQPPVDGLIEPVQRDLAAREPNRRLVIAVPLGLDGQRLERIGHAIAMGGAVIARRTLPCAESVHISARLLAKNLQIAPVAESPLPREAGKSASRPGYSCRRRSRSVRGQGPCGRVVEGPAGARPLIIRSI